MAHSLHRVVGRVSFRRGLQRRVVVNKKQLDSYLAAQTKPSLPTHILSRLEEAWVSKDKSRDVAARKRMYSIFDSIKSEGSAFTGIEVASALVLSKGTKTNNLLPFMNAAHQLARQGQSGSSPIQGTFLNYYNAVRSGALEGANELISKAKIPLSSVEIASKLKKRKQNVACSLAILEAAGLATRFPSKGNQRGGGSLWIAADRRFLPGTLKHNNIAFNCFMSIAKSPKSIGQLSKPHVVYGKTIGSQSGIALLQAVRLNLNLLERAGLVEWVKNNAAQGYFRLTPFGSKIAVEQSQMPFFHPKLRQLINRYSNQRKNIALEMKPSDVRKLDLIQRTIEIILSYSKVPTINTGKIKNSLPKIAKEFNVSLKIVQDAAYGNSTPWSRISKKRLDEFFVPALEQRNPEAANWLRKKLVNASQKPKRLFEEVRAEYRSVRKNYLRALVNNDTEEIKVLRSMLRDLSAEINEFSN